MTTSPPHNNPYDSPCIGVCRVDQASQYCLGCGRSLNEIAVWTKLTTDQRTLIRSRLSDRLSKLTKQRAFIGLE